MTAATEESDPGEGRGWLQSKFKNQLAWAVFLVSAGGILFAAYLAGGGDAPALSRREIFNILVPLFGTWVGTILAFYFSKENFESANESVRKMAAKLTPEQALRQTSVRQVMKTRGAISAVVLAADGGDDAVTLKALRDVLDKGNSRVPVFRAGDIAKYVVHDSTLAKFVADRAMRDPGSVSDATTLTEMLAHPIGSEDIRSLVRKMAFVGLDASLADARNAMLAVKGAQDVFVTRSGGSEEAVEGWLTNSDFAREL
jgi:hypothetical protein